MRDMTKSMVRFSWAMSMFGFEQLRKLVSDDYADRREEEIKSGFDSLSHSVRQQFSGRSRSVYEAGDKLQLDCVDMLWDFSRPSNWGAEKMVDKVADLADRSAEALRDLAHDKPKDATSAEGSSEAREPKEAGNREA